MRGRAAAAWLALSAAVAAGPARADDSVELRYDLKVDVAVTALALGGWVGSELVKSHLAASTCRWCAANPVDTAVRDGLRWDDIEGADTVGDVVAVAGAPLVGLGLTTLAAARDGRVRETAVNALIIAEATALAGATSQLFKFVIGRERPFVHALAPADKPLTESPADNNVSFYSSHTSYSFALVTAGATVATMRRYRLAPVVWAGGLALAATVGYLRIAADRHYFTDVLVGAAAGSAIGIGVPYYFHAPGPAAAARPFALAPVPLPGGGTGLLLSARW